LAPFFQGNWPICEVKKKEVPEAAPDWFPQGNRLP